MPFSLGIPIGFLIMVIGAIFYFKRKKMVWLGVIIWGAVILLGTLGVISLAVNSM